MPNTDPPTVRAFTSLRPDRLMSEHEQGPDGLRDLDRLFTGSGPYNTLRLRPGLEMHHDPASGDKPNHIASGLAAHFGYEAMGIRGTVHFTGDSAETDRAPGLNSDGNIALCEALVSVCTAQGTRMWSQYRPGDTVFVRPADYAPGDTLWDGDQPHRFRGMVDLPDSVTARHWPGVQAFRCDDGFEMTASGSSYPTRADQAPPGYWQRTGDQLMPAAD